MSPRARVRQILLGMLAAAFAAALTGMLYQITLVRRDQRQHPMPGILVDVGGYRLHINCIGQGSPTVILDAGLGDSFHSWRKVQPQIAVFTQVCSYDRAGLGYSEASPFPRTSRVFAEELRRLLINARLPAPYVLVGHSLGGLNIRIYANQNQSSVAGMVLVDSAHPDQPNRLPAIAELQRSQTREAEKFKLEVLFGIPRFTGHCGSEPVEIALNCTFRSARACVGELEGFHESAAQAALTGPFGNIPLSVLSHDPEKLIEEFPPDDRKNVNDVWEQLQEELVHLSTAGRQRIAKNSSHYIQLDRPELVVDEVQNIVKMIREHSGAS